MATILIIEDELESRRLARLMLERHGYTVLEEADAQAGIATARHHHPDLILMDISMPLLDGWTATRMLKSDPAMLHVPIIAWTALNIGGEAGARAAGYDGYIPKPMRMSEFLERIAALLLPPSGPQVRPAWEEPPEASRPLLPQDERRRQMYMEVLYHAARALSASLDPSVVLSLILEQAAASVEATQGRLYLFDAHCRPVQQFYTSGLSELPGEQVRAMFQGGGAEWACRLLQPEMVRNTPQEPHPLRMPNDRHTHSSVAVPLIGREGVLGVMLLDHDQPDHFTSDHVEWLTALTSQAAIALDNARLFEGVRLERKKLAAVLDSAADAIVVVDSQMRIVLLNTAARQVLGLRAEQVGHSLREVWPDHPLPTLLTEAARRGELINLEVKLGEGFYHTTIRPVPDVGYVIVLHDIHLLKEIEQIQLKQERQETERVRRELARHVSPQVAEALLKRGERFPLRRCEAAILFADLRHYTALIEHLGVEAVVEYVLKRYITVMTDMLYSHEGTINKILGDGIMAVFGVPLPQPDAPQRAMRAALSMQRAFAMLREGWWRDLGQDIGMGIGLAWGTVIAGDIGGSSMRTDYTVIGDAVNMASRLCELAAPGEILLSDGLAAAIGGDASPWRLEALPPVTIKGKEQPQQIYRVAD